MKAKNNTRMSSVYLGLGVSLSAIALLGLMVHVYDHCKCCAGGLV